MRILVVAQDFPWPTRTGTHIRLHHVVAALGAVGTVDLFTMAFPGRAEPCTVPEDVPVARLHVETNPLPDFSLRTRLRWLADPSRPLEVAATRREPVASAFARWVAPPYDLVWFSRPATFDHVGRPRLGPTVVDLDDLEERKILGRLAAARHDHDRGSALARARRRAVELQGRLNAARWRRFQASVAGAVDRTVLCSTLDARRAGLANVAVVPNCYEDPAEPAGRLEVGDPPTLLFQGDLHYGPNTDAARWLATDIVPRIRRLRPDVRLRLVGDPDGVVTSLHDPPHVTVVGTVPTIRPELERADAVVVPVRYGSGTRVKIVEAMAHRIPVVSTSTGAEGLELDPGRHLLVADDAETFAAACLRVLEEIPTRRALTAAAYQAYAERHRPAVAAERIRLLVLDTATPDARGVAPSPDYS